jgi:hypothetical protein
LYTFKHAAGEDEREGRTAREEVTTNAQHAPPREPQSANNSYLLLILQIIRYIGYQWKKMVLLLW